jgi:hypothetical protein
VRLPPERRDHDERSGASHGGEATVELARAPPGACRGLLPESQAGGRLTDDDRRPAGP